MNSNSNSFFRVQVRVRVQKKYFFEFKFKFEFGKMIEFFRVRVRSPGFDDVCDFAFGIETDSFSCDAGPNSYLVVDVINFVACDETKKIFSQLQKQQIV